MPTNLRLAPPVTGLTDTSTPEPIRVVLADGHDAMRRSLRRILDAEDGITVISEAFDLAMALCQVEGC